MFALLEMPLTKLHCLPFSPAHLPLQSGAFSMLPSLKQTSTRVRSKLFLFDHPEHVFVLPEFGHKWHMEQISPVSCRHRKHHCSLSLCFEPASDKNSGKTMTFLIILHSEKGLCYRLQNTVSVQKLKCPVQYSPTLEPQGKATPFPGQSCLQASCCLQQCLASSIFLIPTLLHSLTAVSDQPPSPRLE